MWRVVELPELEYIGGGAFRNCKALTNEIVLTGNTLTSIPAYAFQSCGKIARVTVKAPNITSLGTEAFCYGPTPPIYWNTTVQPAISFGTRAIAGGANATTANPYPYVHVMTSVAAYGWEQYYTPVSQLTDPQKTRSDYPGKRTLGLVSIPPADTGSVFWIVDDRIHRTMLIVR